MSEIEPDPELHPQEYIEWRIDKMFDESDLVLFAIWEQIINKCRQTYQPDTTPDQ